MRINVLVFVLCSVGVSYVNCDGFTCTYLKFKDCYGKLGASIFGQNGTDFCSNQVEVQNCLLDSAINCEEYSEWYHADTEAAIRVMCDPDSQMHQFFAQHKDCVSEVLESATHCSANTSQIMYHVSNEKAPFLKAILLRELCRQHVPMYDCFYDEMKQRCGKDAAEIGQWAQAHDHKVTYMVCEKRYGILPNPPSADEAADCEPTAEACERVHGPINKDCERDSNENVQRTDSELSELDSDRDNPQDQWKGAEHASVMSGSTYVGIGKTLGAHFLMLVSLVVMLHYT